MAFENSGVNNHPTDEMLAAFVDGTLDEKQRDQMYSHLADCDDCREFVSDWARLAPAGAGEMGEVVERVGKTPVQVVRSKRIAESDSRDSDKREKMAETVIKCFTCGGGVESSDTFCRHCGAKVGPPSAKDLISDRHSLYENGSLILAIICLGVSFFVHSFFWQFLVAFGVSMSIYLYFRVKREIMLDLIDALRSGDSSKEKEAIERLRRRFRE